MATKAFQKIYTKVTQITKATCSLKATGVGYDELATVNGKLAQVVKIAGDDVTLQVFEGTEGIPTNAEIVFLGKSPTLKVSEQLAGRFFNAFGDPIDGGPSIEGQEVEIGGPSVNPVRRKQPSELIATGIAGIDLNNTLVSGQKIPFFADPDQPFNQVMANVALRAETDKIILGGMGMTNDDYLYFKNVFSNAGALDRIVSFMNTTENPPVERLLIPDMALTAAEYFAVNNNEKVLVLLTEEHSAAAYKMGLRPDATVYTLLTWAVLWALFSRLPEIPKPLQFIARHSFGLYLAHPLVLRLWNEWTTRQPQVTYLRLWQMFALAGGLAIAVILSYLPFGEYLGGAKRRKKILQRRA